MHTTVDVTTPAYAVSPAQVGDLDLCVYAAGKAGLSSYLLSLAPSVRARGVSVSTVRFGFVDTKMAKSPVKPMMITVDRAVEVLMRCVTRGNFARFVRRAYGILKAEAHLLTLSLQDCVATEEIAGKWGESFASVATRAR